MYLEMAFNNLVEFYSPEINSQLVINCEFKMWTTEIFKENIFNINIKAGHDALVICNKNLHPNVYSLFKIICTLLVFTLTPELTTLCSQILKNMF